MRSYEIFHRYEKTWWNLRELPWDQLGKNSITDQDVQFAQAAVLGEATFLPGLHSFLHGGNDDYDLSAFVSIWAYQELQHHFAFRTWLERAGVEVKQEKVDRMRPPFPEGHTLAQTLCSNIIGELVVCQSYAQVADHTADPVLQLIFRNASADEGRHARGFSDYTKMQIQRDPSALLSVLETLYFYAGDKREPVRHPSGVFKGQLPEELEGELSISEGFEMFDNVAKIDNDRLRNRVFGTFSALTGYELDSPRSIRRAIADTLKKSKGQENASAPN